MGQSSMRKSRSCSRRGRSPSKDVRRLTPTFKDVRLVRVDSDRAPSSPRLLYPTFKDVRLVSVDSARAPSASRPLSPTSKDVRLVSFDNTRAPSAPRLLPPTSKDVRLVSSFSSLGISVKPALERSRCDAPSALAARMRSRTNNFIRRDSRLTGSESVAKGYFPSSEIATTSHPVGVSSNSRKQQRFTDPLMFFGRANLVTTRTV
jgi:hypothetical protein